MSVCYIYPSLYPYISVNYYLFIKLCGAKHTKIRMLVEKGKCFFPWGEIELHIFAYLKDFLLHFNLLAQLLFGGHIRKIF